MLPASPIPRSRLAEVFPNCLAAVLGTPASAAAGGLPAVRHAVVVLVDGLGASALRARAGHARTLAPLLSKASTIGVGFPTTTASSIATLTTGELPGRHGLVGYSVLDAAHDRVVNQLSGWDDRLDPTTWQRVPTVFQRAADSGVASFAVGPARYADSGFTRAVLRGARYLAGASIADRVDAALAAIRSCDRSISYLYIPELDTLAHRHGIESAEWTAGLEELDEAMARLRRGLRPGDGALVTADHGVIDVPASAHLIVDPELLGPVRHVAGEPRALQLHLQPDADPATVAAAWDAAYGDAAWVFTRAEATAAELLGPVDAPVASRIGDVLVVARRRVAFYADSDSPARGMVGQHGALSPDEERVPLLGLGDFAR